MTSRANEQAASVFPCSVSTITGAVPQVNPSLRLHRAAARVGMLAPTLETAELRSEAPSRLIEGTDCRRAANRQASSGVRYLRGAPRSNRENHGVAASERRSSGVISLLAAMSER